MQRIALGLVLVATLAAAAPADARPMRTALLDPGERAFADPDVLGGLAAAKANGVSVIRIPVVWAEIARRQPSDATNPGDPNYNWSGLDFRVRQVVDAGLEPLLSVYATPQWAIDRAHAPSPHPSDFGAFMAAIARRFSGSYVLPRGGTQVRVRLWQLWNEPNLKTYLAQDDAPQRYRDMVKAAYPAVKAVHADNVVVAGGLGPFGGADGRYGARPLPYLRATVTPDMPFDVWAMHPYTSGPPVRKAGTKGDASIGDLPRVRSILSRAGHRGVELWATEFSWDSKPPDPFAVPLGEHARWVAEGLYRMWRQNMTLVVWFQLRDNPKGTFEWGETFQSGLYFRSVEKYAEERAKPALQAYRFPFVALPASRRRVSVWGRTPNSLPARVAIERRRRGRWRRVATLRADGDGIFRRHLRGHRGAVLRARVGSEASLPFAARRTRDRFVNPFGGESLP